MRQQITIVVYADHKGSPHSRSIVNLQDQQEFHARAADNGAGRTNEESPCVISKSRTGGNRHKTSDGAVDGCLEAVDDTLTDQSVPPHA
ncbi:MAG: hypothetical protein OXU19_09870 [bacterium]|nr:hypothetical protein [bacterium]MDE0239601.1 hypothetical protein [bacterium]MDE0417258.1 hypothetical protein [bacterium]